MCKAGLSSPISPTPPPPPTPDPRFHLLCLRQVAMAPRRRAAIGTAGGLWRGAYVRLWEARSLWRGEYVGLWEAASAAVSSADGRPLFPCVGRGMVGSIESSAYGALPPATRFPPEPNKSRASARAGRTVTDHPSISVSPSGPVPSLSTRYVNSARPCRHGQHGKRRKRGGAGGQSLPPREGYTPSVP